MSRRALSYAAALVATLFVTGLSAQNAPQTREADWPPPGVHKLTQGVRAPQVVRDVKPQYTVDAMREQIQGTVEVEAVVLTDGKVGDVRVVRSLDKEHGLDEAAVAAVKAWEFRPGRTKDGQAVPVLINIELTFATRKH